MPVQKSLETYCMHIVLVLAEQQENYIHQLSVDTGYRQEDLSGERERERERERDGERERELTKIISKMID